MQNNNPLVTFAVICYNQERFIEEALRSALAQTYSPLEIIITDDCSTDATFSIIEKVLADYNGPHKVIAHRNEKNLGLAGNTNKAWELSSGEFLVGQAGDDISLPHRTSKLVEKWLSIDPRPDLVYSGSIRIDEDGSEILTDTQVAEKTPSIDDTITGRKVFVAGGCTAAYQRCLHFVAGPLNNNVVAEDFVYSFRALLGNGVASVSEPLVLYRQHSSSIIGKLKAARKIDSRLGDFYSHAQLAKLVEYKKAMEAYKVKRPYLRWILNRQIKTSEMILGFGRAGVVKKYMLILHAIVSLRVRLSLNMLSLLIVPLK